MKQLRILTALLLCLCLCFGLAACGDGADAAQTPVPAEVWRSDSNSGETGTGGSGSDAAPIQGTELRVERSTGELTVTRPAPSRAANQGDLGVWTIFVYLCGTDLETEAGMATEDFIEMLDAPGSDSLRFVVQTGGTEEWNNEVVEAGELQRFLIEGEDLWLEDSVPRAGMGRASTLSGFLRWGLENYASEHMGLVLWNHGGGSVTGVCFDETDGDDSLSLRELDSALLEAFGQSGRKFDFIGFDACLMGTLEAANILASYADYMIGSQETEPGSGWDYTAMGSYLVKHPDADGEALGREICDSYLAACREWEEDDEATLSLIDLSRIDPLLTAFNRFAGEMYDAGEDAVTLADMVRNIGKAKNYGGNNWIEGYTNMVDLGGLISACAPYAPSAEAALSALDSAVVYSVAGADHAGASGLSVYYPLSVQGSEELSVFGEICVSPYYLSFVDRQNQSGVNGETADYDTDLWFDLDGFWSWWNSTEDEDYWDYLDGYGQTGESPFITFDVEPFLDDEGDFWFYLDAEGLYYAADVVGLVYELSEDGEDLIELGETYDIYADWESGFFCDDFDGWWLSLPDGQNLATYIVDVDEDYIIYTSPVFLNDEETYLRLRQSTLDGSVLIEGAWDGISESGAASRDLVKLQSGDVIVPKYFSYGLETDEENYYYGWEYTFEGDPEIWYDVMESGDYLYSFRIDDIYGDYYLTDVSAFYVDEEGEIYFYEDLEDLWEWYES